MRVLGLLILLASRAYAGGEAALFQELAVSARLAALGEAGVASEGLDLVPTNPAAFAGADGPGISGSHLALGPETSLEEVLLGSPTAIGSIYLHGLMLHSTDQPALNEQGAQVGIAAYRESALGAGWAMKLQDLSLGLSARQLFRVVGSAEGGGQSFSAGLQYALPWGLRAGLAWRNAGLLSPLAEAADPLQASMLGGVAWRFPVAERESLELFTQLQRQPGGELRSSLAAEFGLGQIVFARGAWQFLAPESAQSRFSMGMGAQGRGLALDLAWVPMGDLGQSYRLTASFHPDQWQSGGATNIASALRAHRNEKGFLLEWNGPPASYLVFGGESGAAESQLTKKAIRERKLQVRARPGKVYSVRVATVDRQQKVVASSDPIEISLQ